MTSQPSLLDLMGDTGQKPKPIASDPPDMPTPSTDIGKTEHCELELVLHYDNEVKGDILVSADGDTNKAVWLPKSQVQFTHAGRNAPATTTAGNPVAGGLPVIIANLPEWLAKDRGLI
jgi:hypothetical protein